MKTNTYMVVDTFANYPTQFDKKYTKLVKNRTRVLDFELIEVLTN